MKKLNKVDKKSNGFKFVDQLFSSNKISNTWSALQKFCAIRIHLPFLSHPFRSPQLLSVCLSLPHLNILFPQNQTTTRVFCPNFFIRNFVEVYPARRPYKAGEIIWSGLAKATTAGSKVFVWPAIEAVNIQMVHSKEKLSHPSVEDVWVLLAGHYLECCYEYLHASLFAH